jgi:hypothetical protein
MTVDSDNSIFSTMPLSPLEPLTRHALASPPPFATGIANTLNK